jgi:16S rRNA (guanine(966)-N(2))-methyltransferase RsmD
MKIASGTLRGRGLESPKNADMRPTTEMCRQALFNICQHACEGAKFLDLFAGSGAIGIEALSRGARESTFVDSNTNCIKCIKANLTKLELTKSSKVIFGNVFDVLKRLGKQSAKYDIIYADPPYHDKHDKGPSLSLQVLLLLEQMAGAGHQLLVPHGLLFIEDAIEIDLKENPLTHFSLTSLRKLGKSVLHEFELSNSQNT